MSKQHQVIIGASAAALEAVEAICRVDKECPITVVSKEPMPLYSRVGLTHFISREVGYDGMQMGDGGYFHWTGLRAARCAFCRCHGPQRSLTPSMNKTYQV